MKKVKIMLLVIVIIAIAAGTFAFKARYNFDYCTVAANHIGVNQYTCTTTNPAGGNRPLTCSNVVLGRKDAPDLAVPVCMTSFTTTQEFGDPTCVNSTNCILGRPYFE